MGASDRDDERSASRHAKGTWSGATMNCGRVSNQLSAYIDRELTGVEMLHIRRHLDDCDPCRSEYEALCRMKTLLGGLRSVEPHPGFVASVLGRWEGQPAPGGSRSSPASHAALF